MLGASGALCMCVAALLVCCSADPHQDSEVSGGEHTGERFDGAHKSENPDPPGGGSLVREVRDSGHGFWPYFMARQHSYGAAGGRRELWPMSPSKYAGYYGDGYPKRNFDEIDLSGLNNFVKKRNIDEIDQTSMPFPYAKRYYRPYGVPPNHSPMSSFDKKRYRADYPMDEIDLSHFPIGSKRSHDDLYPLR